ncbi:MYB-like transcription factor ETC1 [Gossypium australe]|uniref:MYB-like transcription factor ETC1 n=2 Tax=Gossypium TaxID=3633 RepID=A0A5B6VEE0_9ROSI|nr:MYB-like transcription factor ETC1 [Gossypium australe]
MAESEYSSSENASMDSNSIVNFSKLDFTEDQSKQDLELQLSEDEETLVIRMFNLVGERWGLIAGRIPGRTAEEIEKYWNTRYSTSQ